MSAGAAQGAGRLGRIACLGEVMVEVARAPDGTARVGVAGDSYNTAVYLARSLRGAGRVAYVTALGDDPQSARILAALRDEGLDCAHVARIAGAMPGLYMIDTDAGGERRFSYWRATSAARRMFDADSPLASAPPQGFGLVYLTGISLAILPAPARDRLAGWLAAHHRAGGRVAFDPNFRPALWPDLATARAETMRFAALADIAFPSFDDETALFGPAPEGAVIDRYAAAGVRQGALKCGAGGAIALDGSQARHTASPSVRVVDTTAAGDSFNAGYLAALDQGAAGAACLAAGAALAERVIGWRGAILPRSGLAGDAPAV
ncbi:MAG: 2-dehydro-3-deoxygluconokinase [Pseudomonadota bacterium]